MTQRTEDSRDDRRTVVRDGEQRGWPLSAAGYLDDMAGRDEDPAAVFEAARELRTIAEEFDRAPALEREVDPDERMLRAALDAAGERWLAERERQIDEAAGRLYEQERRREGFKWADVPEGSNLHAAYGARAAEMLNTEAQRELPSHDDEAEPVNSWVDTSREQEREDDRALRPADPQWPFVRSDSDREQQREELDLGLER